MSAIFPKPLAPDNVRSLSSVENVNLLQNPIHSPTNVQLVCFGLQVNVAELKCAGGVEELVNKHRRILRIGRIKRGESIANRLRANCVSDG